MWKKLFFIFLLLQYCSLHSYEKGPAIIRDAEIEEVVKEIMIPLLEAAGLSPQSLKLIIIHSTEINAAAGVGTTLFLNTGLIENVKNINQLIGVLAHETGHMAGSHVARFEESIHNASVMAMGISFLGALTGALLSRGDLAMASLMGGQHMGMRSLLHYSRAQESSADQAGASYLAKLEWPLRGAVEFLELIHQKSDEGLNAYNQTHPLTRERIQALKLLIKQPEGQIPAHFEEEFQRIKAKILAYDLPKRALKIYKKNDPLDQYAQSIAYFRLGELEHALSLVENLILHFPKNPYFYELKGQLLEHLLKPEKAVEAYRTAVQLLPKSGLLRIDLGRLLLSFGTPAMTAEALGHFEEAKKSMEVDNPYLWRQLSIVYRRQSKRGMSELCLAQEAVLRENKDKAFYHADQALKFLPKSQPGYIKALDIKNMEFKEN